MFESEYNAVLIFLFFLFVISAKAFVSLLNLFVINVSCLAFLLQVIIFDLTHNFNILYNGARFLNHGWWFSLDNWNFILFLERRSGNHFCEITHIDISQSLENGFLVLFFWALFGERIGVTRKRTDFAVGQKGISVRQFILLIELDNSLNTETHRSVCVMEDCVLWDFADGVLFAVGESFYSREQNVLGLVFSNFVVGL